MRRKEPQSAVAETPAAALTYSALVSSRFVPIDLTDYGQVLDAMLGVEDRYALGLFGPAVHESQRGLSGRLRRT
jgi:hypothetical protein